MNLLPLFPTWAFPAMAAVALLLLARHVWTLWRDTWAYYLAVMHLEQVQERLGGQLPPVSRWWGYYEVLPRGLWLDWQLNQWLSLFFLDPPHTPWELVTGRLQRYVYPQTPSLGNTAPRWLRLLWPARMAWWRLHRWWWELMPWRQRFADALARDKLDPYDPPGHIERPVAGNQG